MPKTWGRRRKGHGCLHSWRQVRMPPVTSKVGNTAGTGADYVVVPVVVVVPNSYKEENRARLSLRAALLNDPERRQPAPPPTTTTVKRQHRAEGGGTKKKDSLEFSTPLLNLAQRKGSTAAAILAHPILVAKNAPLGRGGVPPARLRRVAGQCSPRRSHWPESPS